jgi:uncharacterized OsmC-like protein
MKSTEKDQDIQQSIVINGVNVSNLHQTIDAVQANPTVSKFKFRLNNKWIDGSRTFSSVNGFHGACQDFERPSSYFLHSDEPAVLLGGDTAPNPGEYLLSALAACVTTSMVYHAAAKGIMIQEIESKVEGDVDLQGFLNIDPKVRKGFQNIRMSFAIRADVSDEQIQELVAVGTGFSPAFDTLTMGVPIAVKAERMEARQTAGAA